jgi:hypothetical protein
MESHNGFESIDESFFRPGFFAGCLMICCALSCVVMNERKLARFDALISKARKYYKVVQNVNKPDIKLRNELVFVYGKTLIAVDPGYEK